MNALSRLEEAFVEGIVAGKSATQAAIDAGYAPKNAANRASKLHRKAKVKAAIALRRSTAVAVAQAATNITLTRIFEELGRIGLADIKECFDDRGRFLPLHEMPENIRRAVSSVEVDETYELANTPTSGTEATPDRPAQAPIEPQFTLTRTTKVRFWDKLSALDKIAKLAGYLKQEQKVEGEIVLRWADEP